jgi:hypothetical protein
MTEKRSDKKATVALLVAIVALVAPWGQSAWVHFHEASASIIVSIPGLKTSPRMTVRSPFDVHGEWNNITPAEDMWLMVRSGNEGRWYPVERLQKDANGKWATTGKAIQPAIGLQEIEILQVPVTADGTLIDYIKNLQKRGDPGLNSPPLEAKWIVTLDVTVVS